MTTEEYDCCEIISDDDDMEKCKPASVVSSTVDDQSKALPPTEESKVIEVLDISSDDDVISITEVEVDATPFDIEKFKHQIPEYLSAAWRHNHSACNEEAAREFETKLDNHQELNDLDEEKLEKFCSVLKSATKALPAFLEYWNEGDEEALGCMWTRLQNWVQFCIDKAKDTSCIQAEELGRLGLSIVKTAVEIETQYIARAMVDGNIFSLLLDNIHVPSLSTPIVHSILRMLSSPYTCCGLNENFRSKDANGESAYSKLAAAVMAQDGNGFSTEWYAECELVFRWSDAIACGAALRRARVTFPCDLTTVSDSTVNKFSSAWSSLMKSFDSLKSSIDKLGDEKICARFDMYGILEACDVAPAITFLLRLIRIAPFPCLPSPMKFLYQILSDREGIIYLSYCECLGDLIEELSNYRQKEMLLSLKFDEGFSVHSLMTASEMRESLICRVEALKHIDSLKGIVENEPLTASNVEDDQRVAALIALQKLHLNIRAAPEVIWVLSQKYSIPLLTNILSLSIEEKKVRQSSAFSVALRLLTLVIRETEEPKFWHHAARPLRKLLSNDVITNKNMGEAYTLLEPFHPQGGFFDLDILGSNVLPVILKKIKSHATSARDFPYIRLLECILVSSRDRMRIVTEMMELGFEELLSSSYQRTALKRSDMWMMGEPSCSPNAKYYNRQLACILRIYRLFHEVVDNCDAAETVQLVIMDESNRNNDVTVEKIRHTKTIGAVSSVFAQAALLHWLSCTGMNGQRMSRDVLMSRAALISTLDIMCYSTGDSDVLRMLLSTAFNENSTRRTSEFVGALGMIIALAPKRQSFIAQKDKENWRSLMKEHERRLSMFEEAVASAHMPGLAAILLCDSPNVKSMVKEFVKKVIILSPNIAVIVTRCLLEHLSRWIVGTGNAPVTNAAPVTVSDDEDDVSAGRSIFPSAPLLQDRCSPLTLAVFKRIVDLAEECDAINLAIQYYFATESSSLPVFYSMMHLFSKATMKVEEQYRYQTAILDVLEPILLSADDWVQVFEVVEPPVKKSPEDEERSMFVLYNLPEKNDEVILEKLLTAMKMDKHDAKLSNRIGQAPFSTSAPPRPVIVKLKRDKTVTLSRVLATIKLDQELSILNAREYVKRGPTRVPEREKEKDSIEFSSSLECALSTMCRVLNDKKQNKDLMRRILMLFYEITKTDSPVKSMLQYCCERQSLKGLLTQVASESDERRMLEIFALVIPLIHSLAKTPESMSRIMGFVSADSHPLTRLEEKLSKAGLVNDMGALVRCIVSLNSGARKFGQALGQPPVPTVVGKEEIFNQLKQPKKIQILEDDWTVIKQQRINDRYSVVRDEKANLKQRIGDGVLEVFNECRKDGVVKRIRRHLVKEYSCEEAIKYAVIGQTASAQKRRENVKTEPEAPGKKRTRAT